MKKLMLLGLVFSLNGNAGTTDAIGSRSATINTTKGAITKSRTIGGVPLSPGTFFRVSPNGKAADFGNGNCAYCVGVGCVWNPGSATGGCDSPCTYDKIPCNKLDY